MSAFSPCLSPEPQVPKFKYWLDGATWPFSSVQVWHLFPSALPLGNVPPTEDNFLNILVNFMLGKLELFVKKNTTIRKNNNLGTPRPRKKKANNKKTQTKTLPLSPFPPTSSKTNQTKNKPKNVLIQLHDLGCLQSLLSFQFIKCKC